MLAWLQHHYGWHMVFVSTGLLGIIWGVVWFMVYREPRQFAGANAAEIELIQKGGGVVDLEKRVTEEDAPTARPQDGLPAPRRLSPGAARRRKKAPFNWNDLGLVMSQRKLWACTCQFCLTSTLWFFLTWFPTYLVKYRGMDFIKSGFLASVPFLAAFIGVLCSGVLSDFLIRRGATVGLARKLPIILGLLISTSMIGANFTDSTPWVIFFLAVAFGNGLASITWSLVSALAPVRLLGLTGGVFNFVGNLSSICTPIVIGLLVSKDSFAPAIVYVSSLALLGALSYILLVGRWSGSKPDPPPPRLSQARGLPGHDAGGAMVLRKQSPHPSMRFPSLPDLIDRQETPQRSTGEYALSRPERPVCGAGCWRVAAAPAPARPRRSARRPPAPPHSPCPPRSPRRRPPPPAHCPG